MEKEIPGLNSRDFFEGIFHKGQFRESEKGYSAYINSPSDSVIAGLVIYDTMKDMKSDESTICIGLAAGFGTFCRWAK